MRILAKFNLVFILVFAAAVRITGYIARQFLQQDARDEVLQQAQLLVGAAGAMRTYTTDQLDPLLEAHQAHSTTFIAQTIPFFGATEVFNYLRKMYPAYTYKEATLNPTNPRDRAADWEADIIQRFRNDPQAAQMVGERDTPMGKSLFLARPIRAEAECLTCHSTPAAAPRSLLARYGSANGFGWQPNEIVGAQVISVPFAGATAHADKAFRAFVLSLIAVFGVVILAADALLYFQVLRPARAIARVADQLSLGDMTAEDFPRRGAQELLAMTHSFDRMRKSLEKALRLLGS